MLYVLTMLAQTRGGGQFAILPCAVLLIGLLLFAFWLWMLIDCLTRDFTGNDKLIWVLVLLLLGPLGALIYSVVGRARGTKT